MALEQVTNLLNIITYIVTGIVGAWIAYQFYLATRRNP